MPNHKISYDIEETVLTDMNRMQEAFWEVVNDYVQMVSMATLAIAVTGLIVCGVKIGLRLTIFPWSLK